MGVWVSQGQSLKCRLRSLELGELGPSNTFLSIMQRDRVIHLGSFVMGDPSGSRAQGLSIVQCFLWRTESSGVSSVRISLSQVLWDPSGRCLPFTLQTFRLWSTLCNHHHRKAKNDSELWMPLYTKFLTLLKAFSVLGNFPFPITSNPEKFVRWVYCPCTDEEVETLKDQMTHPRAHY